MAITFEKTPLEWKNSGTEPSADLKENGFSAGYRPAASTFNYQINNTSECLTELQTKLSDLDQDAIKGIKGNGTTINPSSTGVINITPNNIGAAASTHYHNASQITSGVLPIERGGTGATTLEEAKEAFGGGTILYSNESGTTDTITLSDDIGNYKYVEIHYKRQSYTYTREGSRNTGQNGEEHPVKETLGEDFRPPQRIDIVKTTVENNGTAQVDLVYEDYQAYYKYSSDYSDPLDRHMVYLCKRTSKKTYSSTASLVGNTFSHNNFYQLQHCWDNLDSTHKQNSSTSFVATRYDEDKGDSYDWLIEGVYAHTIYAIIGYK